VTEANSNEDAPLDASPDRMDATLEMDGGLDADATLDAAAPADSEPQDGQPSDAGAPGDATSDAATAEDASNPDGATADAGDAAVPSASDAGVDGADEGDASVVITIGENVTPFPKTTCGTAAPAQTFILTNPASTPAAWTASVLEGAPPASPSFVPPSGTVPPGGSATTTLVFPVINEPLDGPSFTVQFSSAGTVTTIPYFEVVAGYIASASNVDLGDVTSTFDPTTDADLPETPFLGSVAISTAADVSSGGMTPASQCASFNVAQSGSDLFHVTGCSPQMAPGANLLLEFDAPEGTPPGQYQTTFTFVGNPEPPCNSPAPFTVTVTLLAPDASAP
jgi:hypothetical protein